MTVYRLLIPATIAMSMVSGQAFAVPSKPAASAPQPAEKSVEAPSKMAAKTSGAKCGPNIDRTDFQAIYQKLKAVLPQGDLVAVRNTAYRKKQEECGGQKVAIFYLSVLARKNLAISYKGH